MRSLLALLLLAALLATGSGVTPTRAQEVAAEGFVSPLEPLDTSSPRATLLSVYALGQDLDARYGEYTLHPTAAGQRGLREVLDRSAGLFDFGDTPPAAWRETVQSSFGFLKDILVRLPAIDPASLAGDGASAPDRTRLPGTEIDIIRATDGAGRFVFSRETVARLPEFHARIIPLPPLRPTPYESWRDEQVRFTGPLVPGVLTRAMPEVMETTVLDTPVWKIAAIVLLLMGGVWVASLWARVRNHWAAGTGPLGAEAWRMTMPLAVGLLALAIRSYALDQISPSGRFFHVTQLVTLVIAIGAVAWLARLVLGFLAEWIIAKPGFAEHDYDSHLVRLVARVFGVLAAAGVVIYGAGELGVPLLGLVAGMGVGGIALALAAQSTVENLFGGVSIFADRPFRVGDFIIYPGGRGVVEAIGPRSTRLRADDGMQITVPNADLAKMQVTNKTCRDATLFLHVVGLRHDTPLARLGVFCHRMEEVLRAYPVDFDADPPPRARLVAIGPSSIDVEIHADLLARSEDEFYRLQEALLLAILTEVEALGLALAFPTQTVMLARNDQLPVATA